MTGMGAILHARRGSRSLVRGGLAGLVVLLALLLAAPASARPPDPLERYAQDDVGVVRRDDRRAERAARRRAQLRRQRPASRPRRRTSARTCGARWSPSGWGSSATREPVDAARPHADDARAHGALRRRGPVLQLVRPPHRREAHDLAADRRRRRRRSSPRSTTAGSPSACAIVASRVPRAARRARRRCSTRWTSASTTGPTSTGSSSTTRPTTGERRPAATTRSSPRAGSPSYIGIEKGELPQREYYGRWRTFPDTCDWSLASRRSPSASRARYLGQSVFEGAYPYNGTRVTPSWGGSMFEALMPSLFVPEEALGPAELGRQPPAHRARADPPRADARPATATGASRRPTSPRAATAAYGVDGDRHGPERQRRPTRTARSSTTAIPAAATAPAKPDPPPSAYTNGVVTPHAAFLALRWAPREARRQPAPARARLPRHVREVGLPRHASTSDSAASRTPTSHSTRA